MTATTHPPGPRLTRLKKKLRLRGVEYRRIGRIGSSLYVTLSQGCAGTLRVKHGDVVQVLPQPSGTVLVAPIGRRVSVERYVTATARENVSLRRELLRAKKRLLALPVRQVNRGFNAGFLAAYRRDLMDVWLRMDALTGAVEQLCEVLAPSKAAGPVLPDGVHAYESPPPD